MGGRRRLGVFPMTIWQKMGRVVGPVTFFCLLFWFHPQGVENPDLARVTAAIAGLVAVFWITEALPLPITSLFPFLLFPLFGVMKTNDVARQYMNKYIFLFLGGFLIAYGMEKWQLHRRIAFLTVSLLGTKPSHILLGFLLATSFLSMWISNTATTLMMLPIALSLVAFAEEKYGYSQELERFCTALFLLIAYSANIGGIATLIGTPPNVILAGMMEKYFPHYPPLDFISWFLLGFPLAICFLLCLYLLFWWYTRPFTSTSLLGSKEIIQEEMKKLGPFRREEKWMLAVFLGTASLWMTRKGLQLGSLKLSGWGEWLPYADDSTVAMAMAFSLFLIPATDQEHKTLLEVEDLSKLPWGILLLFGGGFALAEGFRTSGLSLWIGQQFASLQGFSLYWLVVAICFLLTFLTEVTSNTVTTQLILPILASLAIQWDVPPLLLMLPATLSASCAFMLPVATMPNAIVFGTERIPIQHMVLFGILLNLLGVIWISSFVYLLTPYLFNL